MSRGNGSGSVTELGPSRWWARGPRPARESLGVWPTRDEAQAVVDGACALLAGAVRTRLPGVKVRDFGARVLAERARDLPRSAQAERCRWKRLAAAPFADDAIGTLAAPTIDRWARTLVAALPGSARPTLSLLSAICGQAVREGLLAANPCRDVKIRLPARTHEPWTYLVPDEQTRLVAAPIPEIDALQIGALLGSGIRDGEMFSLRLADAHVHHREPHIVIRHGSPWGPPKGRKIRRVPLFGLGLRSFVRWLEVLDAYCPANPNGLAFPGPRGGFQDAGCFLVRQTHHDGRRATLNDFQEALAAAGIVTAERHDGRPVRAHDLRHTYAASLVSGWWGDPWRLEDLCAVMGHSSITITQRYAHLAPGRVADLVSRTPGLPSGDAPRPLRALPTANAAPFALRAAGADGTGSSRSTAEITRGTSGNRPAGNPAVTRERALAGLRALARRDLVAARALAAEGWDEAALCQLFEAALDEDTADAAPATPKRGRR